MGTNKIATTGKIASTATIGGKKLGKIAKPAKKSTLGSKIATTAKKTLTKAGKSFSPRGLAKSVKDAFSFKKSEKKPSAE